MSFLRWLFSWQGRIGRLHYLRAGLCFTVLKYIIDYSIAGHFGIRWRISNYIFPNSDVSPFQFGSSQPAFSTALWLVAIPFFCIGIALTLRRLNDAGYSPSWVCLFFLPYVNLALFAWMCLAPPVPNLPRGRELIRPESLRGSTFALAFVGIAASVAIGTTLVLFGTYYMATYGWGLFLGVPFLIGFLSAWFLNLRALRPISATIGQSVLATVLVGLALIGFRVEGLICLLMALPLALPFSITGALFARYLLSCSRRLSTSTYAACLVIIPLLMFGEHAANLEPPVIGVTTTVVIEAPISTVWKNVIAFPPLAEPDELIFRAGIAYPTSANIVGSGSGAVRFCRFSTGDFVEPITVWDENRLLAFNVTAQPKSMRELSPWKITTPHLEHNYMRSRHGQFRLVALSDHRTLLEGTTWYQNYFWPQPYWRAWSDGIVHRIHMRVLLHVKQLSESS